MCSRVMEVPVVPRETLSSMPSARERARRDMARLSVVDFGNRDDHTMLLLEKMYFKPIRDCI
jgi:hypothetical protein